MGRLNTDSKRIGLKDRFVNIKVLTTLYDAYKCFRERTDVMKVDSVVVSAIYENLLSSKNIIFYGASVTGHEMLKLFKYANLTLPIEIWDMDAENISDLEGITVVAPRFHDEKAKYVDTIFILTMSNEVAIEAVSMTLSYTICPSKIYGYQEVAVSILKKVPDCPAATF